MHSYEHLLRPLRLAGLTTLKEPAAVGPYFPGGAGPGGALLKANLDYTTASKAARRLRRW